MQEKEIRITGEKGKEQIGIGADMHIGMDEAVNQSKTQSTNEQIYQSTNTPDLGLSSALGIFSPEVHGEHEDDYIKKLEEKKKKRRRGLGR